MIFAIALKTERKNHYKNKLITFIFIYRQINLFLEQLGERIPGSRRFANRKISQKEGVKVDELLVEKISKDLKPLN